jgi:hypothetical protein
MTISRYINLIVVSLIFCLSIVGFVLTVLYLKNDIQVIVGLVLIIIFIASFASCVTMCNTQKDEY